MNDKKSCENCRHSKNDICYLYPSNVGAFPAKPCNKWQRNPHLWLSILPTEPGWYWWKLFHKESLSECVRIFKNEAGKLVSEDDGEGEILITDMSGLWQGPITPKEGK